MDEMLPFIGIKLFFYLSERKTLWKTVWFPKPDTFSQTESKSYCLKTFSDAFLKDKAAKCRNIGLFKYIFRYLLFSE